ncbi:MAG: Hpt domain-containing protein [Gammaproteobacteria bacterium]|nr:Hpt domain-containing protein [Gammaproteobacteria bacterium]
MAGEKIVVKVDPDLEELIPGFLENRARDLTRLREALGKNDLPSVQSVGHSLKGVGGGYGFTRLSEIGAEMERAARAGDPAPLPGLVSELADYLGRVVVEYG